MDVHEKRGFPFIPSHSKRPFLGYESKNQNSAMNIFQHLLLSPCTCKNFWTKPFPGQSKLIIYLHYITHTEILLS